MSKPYALKDGNLFSVAQKFRVLKIKLDTGEDEVLINSLISKKVFPKSIFKDLYYRRWGVVIFYKTLKSRLALENFTGKSAEAIKQEFYATLLITNLERSLQIKLITH